MEVSVHRMQVMTIGKNPPEMQDGGQYRIDVDGRMAGFVGYQKSAPIRMHKRFTDEELAEIESQVAMQISDVGVIVQPPEEPKKKPGEQVENDDFD